jgi:xylulokinase
MTYFLGIDVSTTGAKALIIDEQGNVAASQTTEYPLSTPPLWSEQEPRDCGIIRVRALSLRWQI